MKVPSKTTRCEQPIRTIADIEAIERTPYDELVPAENVYELFAATAAHHGDRPALTLMRSEDPRDVEIALTHRELLAEVTRAANLFASVGVRGDDVIAIVAKTHGAVPALIWGAEVAGVASCLNYMLSAEVIVELLRAEKAKVLVCPGPTLDPELWSKLRSVIAVVTSLESVIVIGGGAPKDKKFIDLELALVAQSCTELNAPRLIGRDTLASLFHTGGTTGIPKLVAQTHGNQIHAAWALAQSLEISEQDVVLNGLPLFHVGGLSTVGLTVLAAGAHVIIVTSMGYRNREVVDNIWKIVEHYKVTILGAVPTTIGTMADVPIGHHDLSSLRLSMTGGAAISQAVGERFEKHIGVPLIEQYGMTETAATIASTTVRGAHARGCVGLRHPFSGLRVVESQEGGVLKDCRPGTKGMVICRGPQVVASYVDPKHNAGTFTADGWFNTGDLGYLTDDQRLVLTGRQKDLIIRSGHNIDPAAIEEIANTHPSVAASGAVGMPDAYAGEVPVIFVIARPGETINPQEISKYIQERIAEPPARPRHVFVTDKLPVTAVGKIFKPTLREQAVIEKLRMEAKTVDDRIRIVDVRFDVDANGRQVALLELNSDECTLPHTSLELSLRTALRDLTISTQIRWR